MTEKEAVRYAEITWGFHRPASELAELVQRIAPDLFPLAQGRAIVFGGIPLKSQAMRQAREYPGCQVTARGQVSIPCVLGSRGFVEVFALVWDNSFSAEMGAVVRAGAVDASWVARVAGGFEPAPGQETWGLPWDLSEEETSRFLDLGRLLVMKGHDAQWAFLAPVPEQGQLERALRKERDSAGVELGFRTVTLPVPQSGPPGR